MEEVDRALEPERVLKVLSNEGVYRNFNVNEQQNSRWALQKLELSKCQPLSAPCIVDI
jgi:hypothetical protein